MQGLGRGVEQERRTSICSKTWRGPQRRESTPVRQGQRCLLWPTTATSQANRSPSAEKQAPPAHLPASTWSSFVKRPRPMALAVGRAAADQAVADQEAVDLGAVGVVRAGAKAEGALQAEEASAAAAEVEEAAAVEEEAAVALATSGIWKANQPSRRLFSGPAPTASSMPRPFPFAGQPSVQPSYAQNVFGFTFPRIALHSAPLDPRQQGRPLLHALRPAVVFTLRPVSAPSLTRPNARGNLSGLTQGGVPVTIYDPTTGKPFANNTILPNRISPQATALLNYVPLPNLPGATQNYQRLTSSESNTTKIGFRYVSLVRQRQQRARRLAHRFGLGAAVSRPRGAPLSVRTLTSTSITATRRPIN